MRRAALVAALAAAPGCAQIFGLDPTERRDGGGGGDGPPGGDGPLTDGGRIYATCAALKQAEPEAPSGRYTIDPGTGLAEVGCDMETAGGGWTVVYAATGADNEQAMTSDTVVAGDPIAGGAFNTSRAVKIAVADRSIESIFVRPNGRWLAVTAPLFDAGLAVPGSHAHVPVAMTASDASTTDGFIGYATANIGGGGDFGVSMVDGMTCGGLTVQGFDHHDATRYFHLNCGCERQYLYSYSAGTDDGDAGYDVAVALGAWSATVGCGSGEGGSLSFYAGMR